MTVESVIHAMTILGLDPREESNGSYTGTCPCCKTARKLIVSKGTKGRAVVVYCNKCGATNDDALDALGVDDETWGTSSGLPAAPPAASAPALKALSKPTKVLPPHDRLFEYTLDNLTGSAVKLRFNKPDGSKVCSWFECVGSKYREGITPRHADLYNLSAVRAAIARGATIVLNEGEPACDRFQQDHSGPEPAFVATCGPSGAGSFSKENGARLAAQLRGAKRVIAVVDRDKDGDKWADDVRAAIRPVELRWSKTSENKTDLRDHLDAGGTLDDLVRSGRVYAPAVDLLDPSVAALPPVWNVQDLLRAVGTTMLWAAPGSLKTWTLLTIALTMLRASKVKGTKLFGHFPILEPWKHVLWVSTEEDAGGLKHRALQACAGLGYIPPPGSFDFRWAPDLIEPLTLDDLEGLVATGTRPDVIILDSLTGLRPQEDGVNNDADNDAANRMTKKLRGLANAYELSILIAHHTGRVVTKGYRGPSEWGAAVDCMYGLLPGDNKTVVLRPEKNRDGRLVSAFSLQPTWDATAASFKLAYIGTQAHPSSKNVTQVEAHLRKHGPTSQTALRKALLMSESTILRALTASKEAGLVEAVELLPGKSPVYDLTTTAKEFLL